MLRASNKRLKQVIHSQRGFADVKPTKASPKLVGPDKLGTQAESSGSSWFAPIGIGIAAGLGYAGYLKYTTVPLIKAPIVQKEPQTKTSSKESIPKVEPSIKTQKSNSENSSSSSSSSLKNDAAMKQEEKNDESNKKHEEQSNKDIVKSEESIMEKKSNDQRTTDEKMVSNDDNDHFNMENAYVNKPPSAVVNTKEKDEEEPIRRNDDDYFDEKESNKNNNYAFVDEEDNSNQSFKSDDKKEEQTDASSSSSSSQKTSHPLQNQKSNQDILSSLDQELLKLDEKSRLKRFENINHILQDIDLKDKEIRKEINTIIFENNKKINESYDENEIRIYIRQLVAEMEMRSKWEAVRLQHLLDLIEERASIANKATLKAQKLKADLLLEKDLSLKTLEYENMKQLALSDLNRKANDRRENELIKNYEELKNNKEKEIKEFIEQKKANIESELEKELSNNNHDAIKQDNLHKSKYENIKSIVSGLTDMKSKVDYWELTSCQLQKLSYEIAKLGSILKPGGPTPTAVLRLKQNGNNNNNNNNNNNDENNNNNNELTKKVPLSHHVKSLSSFEASDPLIHLCSKLINDAEESVGLDRSLPSRAELWSSYENFVKPACLAVLYVPSSLTMGTTNENNNNKKEEDDEIYGIFSQFKDLVVNDDMDTSSTSTSTKLPGAASHLYGGMKSWFVTKFEIIPNTYDNIKKHFNSFMYDEIDFKMKYDKLTDKEKLILKTEKSLKEILINLEKGDLHKALTIAESVQGPAAEPLADWKKDATCRLAAEQSMEVLHAHGSVLNGRFVA